MSNDPEHLITPAEAYAAMYGFLQLFNARYKSDDVAILLTGLSVASDGKPMDQSYLQEWNECLDKARNNKIDVSVRFTDNC